MMSEDRIIEQSEHQQAAPFKPKMSRATYIAYIDESGDEGFKFGQGSSKWLVLSAVVLRRNQELGQVKIVDEIRRCINEERNPQHRSHDKKPLHFRRLKHDEKKYFASCIGQADLRSITVLVDKPLLTDKNLRQSSYLYSYAIGLLSERISWYCRDDLKPDDEGDGTVELVFSKRDTTDYDKLSQYLCDLAMKRDSRIAGNIITAEQMSVYSHGKRLGLQIADAVASGYACAYEPNSYGMTEDSYRRLLLPCAYRYKDRLLGYGEKLFPHKTEEEQNKELALYQFHSDAQKRETA